MKYLSTKTFGNERGLSCAFRQWRADSHCNLIHGYSLGFRFIFEADSLDERNWVYDFGNTKWIKEFLDDFFDHSLAVAIDDPETDSFISLQEKGLARVLWFRDGVGCERFAEFVYTHVARIVPIQTGGRVRLKSVECFEHGANSAIFEG